MSIAVNVGSPGLANRIKTYASILTRYKEIRTVKEADTFIFDNIKLAEPGDTEKYDTFDNWRFRIDDNEYQYAHGNKYIDLLYHATPPYFRGKYMVTFGKFKINQDILDYVSDFIEEWDENTIGLHIRSWYCDRHKYHSNELFENAIDLYDKDKKIFLCGDNDEVLKHFEDKYGDRIIKHPQKRFNHPHLAESGHNHETQASVDAFIDLLLLSHCDKIVGTYASTFTEVAWWFGDTKPRVTIPEPPNLEESFKNRIFQKL